MLTRSCRRFMWFFAGLLLVMLIVGSNKHQRQIILSYLFDGVRPVDAESKVIGLSSVKKVAGESAELRYKHESYKSCDIKCHGDRKSREISSDPSLNMAVPQLCYQCHEDPLVSDGSVNIHGPVAVGACGFCHNPHGSDYPFFLKMEVPGLCYQCHEVETVRSISGHGDQSYASCLDCHQTHSSPGKYLLKVDRGQVSQ
ncbi:MAG: cytochrome c3 family protein [Planctomycetota bacterium]